MLNIISICLGSCLGALSRYFITEYFFKSNSFPWATLLINLSGCFLIGFLFNFFPAETKKLQEFKNFLFVGFLGSYTTFSSFGLQIHGLIKNGKIKEAFLYICLSLLIGIFLVFLGNFIAKKLY